MATLVVIVVLAATGHGTLGGAGGPPGTDFASFYAAGKAALEGAPGTPYDPAAHFAREQALFGPETPFYAWQYPPIFLLVVTPLAKLPYLPALVVWQAVSLLSLPDRHSRHRPHIPGRRALKHGTRSNGSPFSLRSATRPCSSISGTARTASSARHCSAARSPASTAGRLLAGMLIGLLAYKPQLGLMIPIAFLAGGRWRVIIAAALTVAALVLLAGLVFGPEVWRAFLGSTGYSRSALLEGGDVAWHKFQTVYAAVRMWGGSLGLAYAVQAVATLVTAIALARLWRSRAAYPLKAAALGARDDSRNPVRLRLRPDGARAGDRVPGARRARPRAARPYERTALAMLWIVPLVARSVAATLAIPIGIAAVIVVFALTVRRGARDFAESGPSERRPSIQLMEQRRLRNWTRGAVSLYFGA